MKKLGNDHGDADPKGFSPFYPYRNDIDGDRNPAGGEDDRICYRKPDGMAGGIVESIILRIRFEVGTFQEIDRQDKI